MKLLKFSLILLLMSTLFLECDDETTLNSSQTDMECFGLTNSEIETIGGIHNQYLSEVYQSVDFSACTNCREDII